jgi:murein DD-endopeptidase MepM/ murein hydrolase activator NlpD
MLREARVRPALKTILVASVLLGVLSGASANAGASTTGGAGLGVAPVTGKAKTLLPVPAPVVQPLAASLLQPVPIFPQLSAGFAARRITRHGVSGVAIAFVSSARELQEARIDVVRRSDGLSIFDALRALQPGVVRRFVWYGRASSGAALNGDYDIRISVGGDLKSASAPAPVGAAPPPPGAAPDVVAPPPGVLPPPNAAVLGSFSFVGSVFPVRGRHGYGDAANAFGAGRDGHRHQGQDVLATCGTPLVAAVGGIVRTRAVQWAAGNYVVIDDPSTRQSYVYAHLRQPAFVHRGQVVTAGEPIGIVGETGDATTCHLHFEQWTAPGWYAGGEPIDPLPTLKSWDHAAK